MPRRQQVRHVVWVGVAALVVFLAFGLTDRLLMPPPGPTERNAQRIRPGMTRADVEAILGGEGERSLYLRKVPWRYATDNVDHHAYTWTGTEGEITVHFGSCEGPNDIVENVTFTPDPRTTNRTLLQRVRSWLGY